MAARGLITALLGCALASVALAQEPEESEQPWRGGRLLATGGATPLEGGAGGGVVPWGVLAGYGTEDEIGGAAFVSRVGVQDYDLQAFGVAASLWNRVEVSLAKQRFDVQELDEKIEQLVLGAKLRLAGDLIYTPWPALALGVQYKRNLDFDLPEALGARDDDDVDVYLAASKLFLEGVFGCPLLLGATVRATRANQIGLLGFGGDRHERHRAMLEASAAVLLTRRLALGYEYRNKPNNLGFADEDPWQDVFAAYFVNKHLSVVGGYVSLGNVALWGRQSGYYLSLQASF